MKLGPNMHRTSKLGPNIHRTINYGTGIVFIGNMEGGEGALVTKDWHRISLF